MPRSVARIRQDSIPLGSMLDSWVLALEAENKSPKTIRSYGDSARALIRFSAEVATTAITTDDVRRFLAAEQTRLKPNGEPVSAASAAIHFRNLRVFFGWLTAEEPGLMPVSPMARIAAPTVPKTRKAPFSDAELRALLATARGDALDSRRDTAIMRVLIDTGMRVSGLAGLRYVPGEPELSDVHLAQRLLVIRLKGGDQSGVPIGKKTVAAIDRYLRGRPRHAHAELPWLWLAPRGQFTHWGIRQMIERRATEAGVTGAHPHRFRRTFAHSWLGSGGTEFDLMNITGWKSRDMIGVYAGELGGERARTAHARLSPGDRL